MDHPSTHRRNHLSNRMREEGRLGEVSAWGLQDNNKDAIHTNEGESHLSYFSIYTNGTTNSPDSSLILLPSLLR